MTVVEFEPSALWSSLIAGLAAGMTFATIVYGTLFAAALLIKFAQRALRIGAGRFGGPGKRLLNHPMAE